MKAKYWYSLYQILMFIAVYIEQEKTETIWVSWEQRKDVFYIL